MKIRLTNFGIRLRITSMLGDCDRSYCGHSLMYHTPLVGCMKCSCPEFR